MGLLCGVLLRTIMIPEKAGSLLGDKSALLVAIALVFWGGACSSDQETHSVEMLSLSNIDLQSTSGRVWSEVRLRELVRLPGEAEDRDLIFTPTAARADRQGNIYVVDLHAVAIHGFDSAGSYVATYGGNIGAGPGELMSIVNLGIIGDSTVYIVDENAQRISYFGLDGAFLRSEVLEFSPVSHQFTSGGRSYSLVGGLTDHLFETSKGADIVPFGIVPQAPHGRSSSCCLGFTTTFGNNLLFAPHYFPILVQYKPDGTIEYVRGTPDWGTVEPPKWETVGMGGMQGYSFVGQSLHEAISVDEGKVYVFAYVTSEPGYAVDVYDAQTGTYEYSFRIGEIENAYMLNQRLYGREGDTAIVVYAVE